MCSKALWPQGLQKMGGNPTKQSKLESITNAGAQYQHPHQRPQRLVQLQRGIERCRPGADQLQPGRGFLLTGGVNCLQPLESGQDSCPPLRKSQSLLCMPSDGHISSQPGCGPPIPSVACDNHAQLVSKVLHLMDLSECSCVVDFI